MQWTKEAHRVYAREYAWARRNGYSIVGARHRAMQACEKATGLKGFRQRRNASERMKRDGPDPRCGYVEPQPHIAPERIEEARELRAIGHASLTAALMGDPLPGRSALDRRNSQGA